MPTSTEQVAGSEATQRISIDNYANGWSTRTAPHLLPDGKLSVADNVCYYRDGLVSKRPGNGFYGASATGKVGTNAQIQAMARFYYGTPRTGKLIVQSAGALYVGNDTTGAFSLIASGFSTTQRCTFTQMRDQDMTTGNQIALIICDGARVPYAYDGVNLVPFKSTAGFLPHSLYTGNPITPKYCANWGQHLVLAGEPTDTGGLYISDAQRPESFTGYAFTDTGGTTYYAYYPGGQDGVLGDITGLAVLGPYLIIFFSGGVVTGINTGSYGALQYQFQRVSSSTGCTAPASIVAFDNFVVFFGGDRFYATDGTAVFPLDDEIPTVYSNTSRSTNPPLLKNIFTVFGCRRASQYWASYDSGNGVLDQMVVFDISAGGGYTFGGTTVVATDAPNGGAWARWLGMSVNAAVECRGPGDTQQLFWGRSDTDIVAQHDIGTYSDFGAAIALEIRGKAYFLDKPASPKTVQAMYVMLVYDLRSATYQSIVTPYMIFDSQQESAPAIVSNVSPTGVFYGTRLYGTFMYSTIGNSIAITAKSYPQRFPKGLAISPGLVETSTNPFNLIGFIFEVTVDAPEDP